MSEGRKKILTFVFFCAQSLGYCDLSGVLRQQITRSARNISGPAYFAVFMGEDGLGNRPADSHTFASFVWVSANGAQTWTTISWLPANFDRTRRVCVFKNLHEAAHMLLWGNECKPEAGRNYSLNQTLRWARDAHNIVDVWPPLRIEAAFYARAVARIAWLNSGRLKYIADDSDTRERGVAVNCMHAVEDLAGIVRGRGGFLGIGYGIWGLRGTRHVLSQLASLHPDWFVDDVDTGDVTRYQL